VSRSGNPAVASRLCAQPCHPDTRACPTAGNRRCPCEGWGWAAPRWLGGNRRAATAAEHVAPLALRRSSLGPAAAAMGSQHRASKLPPLGMDALHSCYGRRFSFATYKMLALTITFWCYCLFHATRKPPSVVKRWGDWGLGTCSCASAACCADAAVSGLVDGGGNRSSQEGSCAGRGRRTQAPHPLCACTWLLPLTQCPQGRQGSRSSSSGGR
jgi:hypothetical protein